MDNTKQLTPSDSKTLLGFWIYLMTDCLLFGCLFATYAVLRNHTFGGPGAAELFSLPYVLVETLLLLTSSFTAGLMMLAAHRARRRQVLVWLVLTFALGAGFLGMELSEFGKLIAEGNSFRRSGFLSSFFTLVGTHGLHIATGLLWMGVMAFQVDARGLVSPVLRRLALLNMFWHFLDVVWIFIFTIVYLMGALN